MDTQARRSMSYPARIDWARGDTINQWNEILASIVEVFGLPGTRYTTYTDLDYMDFNFVEEQDRLLFLTGWPAYVPNQNNQDQCGCFECNSHRPSYVMSRMITCPDCGNKRCPRATWHENKCTESNEPGQLGSRY